MRSELTWRAAGPPVAATAIRGVWPYVTGVLIVGYLTMGRTFAYLGIPPLKLFVGEIALGAFLLMHLRTFVERWGAALIVPSRLSGLMWALVLFLSYGAFEVVRGIDAGYHRLTALQCFAFNYYPLYLFLGLTVGVRYPDFLPRLVRALGWAYGVYGVAHILVLSHLPYVLPWANVLVFGGPSGAEVPILGVLSFERQLMRAAPLLLLNGFVLLGLQVRAQWVAFLVGLLVLGFVTKTLRRLALAGLTMVMLLTVLYATGIDIPSPPVRGGTMSVGSFVARVVAPLDPSLATEYSDEAGIYAATASWRTTWWRAIWASVHETFERTLLGHGYGFPLPSVAPNLNFPDVEEAMRVRTPHNFFFYALGYGGWIGVTVTLAFLLALARLLWKGYRRSGQPYGVVLLAAVLTDALFSSVLESPYTAIPFYILAGLSLAPALARPGLQIQAPVRPGLLPALAGARAPAGA